MLPTLPPGATVRASLFAELLHVQQRWCSFPEFLYVQQRCLGDKAIIGDPNPTSLHVSSLNLTLRALLCLNAQGSNPGCFKSQVYALHDENTADRRRYACLLVQVRAVLEEPVCNSLNGKHSWWSTGFAYGVWTGVMRALDIDIQARHALWQCSRFRRLFTAFTQSSHKAAQ